jgi:hypothetical protein
VGKLALTQEGRLLVENGLGRIWPDSGRIAQRSRKIRLFIKKIGSSGHFRVVGNPAKGWLELTLAGIGRILAGSNAFMNFCLGSGKSSRGQLQCVRLGRVLPTRPNRAWLAFR